MRFLLDPRHDIDAALLSYRRVFWSLGLFSGVINLLVLVPSLYMMQVYDRVLTSRNETTLFMLTLIALGLFMFSGLIEWVRGQVMIRMSAGLDDALGERIFDAAFARSLREHNANPAQVLSDLSTLRQLITGQGLIALLDAPWLPIFLLVAFIFHFWFGVLTLVLALVLAGLALWGELATRTGLGEANRLSVQSAAYVNSTLQNAEVIQALGMLGPLRQRWSLLQQRIIAAQAQASDRSARITPVTGSGCLAGSRGAAFRWHDDRDVATAGARIGARGNRYRLLEAVQLRAPELPAFEPIADTAPTATPAHAIAATYRRNTARTTLRRTAGGDAADLAGHQPESRQG
jgi:ATP-binding cassette subfamily C exporter for protease/lipase